MSYEKYYPGGWQSGESGGTPITPEALNHIENGIKQTYSDFAPAQEDASFPGCYYRMVNGIKEWINPPMIPGVEYRTTERRAGMAVFTKLVDCGFMPNSAVKNIEIGVAASSIIDYRLMITSDDGTLTSIAPYQNTNLENNLRCVLFNHGINILTNADLSNFSGLCVVKYYKA